MIKMTIHFNNLIKYVYLDINKSKHSMTNSSVMWHGWYGGVFWNLLYVSPPLPFSDLKPWWRRQGQRSPPLPSASAGVARSSSHRLSWTTTVASTMGRRQLLCVLWTSATCALQSSPPLRSSLTIRWTFLSELESELPNRYIFHCFLRVILFRSKDPKH